MTDSTQTDAYKRTIRELSDRIVEAQRPIRILDAIKWDQHVEDSFLQAQGKELPQIDAAYYEKRKLSFDPAAKREQFHAIERDVVRLLGQFSPVGSIMRRMCREYQMVVRMLEARGTREFSAISQELYGSSRDAFHAGDPTLADLGTMMTEALTKIDNTLHFHPEEKTISGEQAVTIMQHRMNKAFAERDGTVRVLLNDGIVADAAAGADYLKIRKDAMFSERDLKVLEVHEGWVHLGTTLNGLSQPICTFLSKGPPSSTVTQEGLAILMEILAFASYPARLRRITNRIQAVSLAENGANFLDVYRFFVEQGFGEQESYLNTARVFRGSLPDGPPFTKDICYSKGFVLVYNYLQLAVRRGALASIPMLFCGKTTLEDIKTLTHLAEEGIVTPPVFLPPQFQDLNALAAWMCFSNFLNRLNLDRIEADYAIIL